MERVSRSRLLYLAVTHWLSLRKSRAIQTWEKPPLSSSASNL